MCRSCTLTHPRYFLVYCLKLSHLQLVAACLSAEPCLSRGQSTYSLPPCTSVYAGVLRVRDRRGGGGGGCRAGGVDTFKASAKRMDTRVAVRESQNKIKETVKALHAETFKAQVAIVREMEAKRDQVLTAGPVKIARAALEVRQERLRRLTIKTAESKRRREKAGLGLKDGEEEGEDAPKAAIPLGGTKSKSSTELSPAQVSRLPKSSALLS